MSEDWLEAELDERRKQFALGDYQALAEAVSLCLWNKQPLADWMEQPLMESLLHTMNTGGASQVGRGGGHLVQTGLAYLHRTRAAAYRVALLDGKLGASQRASDMLRDRKSPAWGTARQVKRSFDKVENTLNRS